MKSKHLKMLTEINWDHMNTFVSMPDGRGNWIFGDGVYCLRMPGTHPVKEGDDKILHAMVGYFDIAASDHSKCPITLPSVGYLKKKNKAKMFQYRIPVKLPDNEIFVNSMLLYHMLKILPGAAAFSVDTFGYYPYSHERKKVRCVYLVSDKGEGILLPMILPGRLYHEKAR